MAGYLPRFGIIPAYAGSTLRYSIEKGGLRDHPRVCGEHCSRNRPIRSTRGSSPRMRGARFGLVVDPVQRGIIPAYAGSTQIAPGQAVEEKDHPRVCGEH